MKAKKTSTEQKYICIGDKIYIAIRRLKRRTRVFLWLIGVDIVDAEYMNSADRLMPWEANND